jgi:hypothetical protein
MARRKRTLKNIHLIVEKTQDKQEKWIVALTLSRNEKWIKFLKSIPITLSNLLWMKSYKRKESRRAINLTKEYTYWKDLGSL